MDKIGLTAKQKQVFEFLRMYHKTYGVFPSTREIAQGKIDGQVILNKRVESNVHNLLKSLQKRGWIEVMPYTPRGIRII
jgi:SOS-response transcriptional repressor LexA